MTALLALLLLALPLRWSEPANSFQNTQDEKSGANPSTPARGQDQKPGSPDADNKTAEDAKAKAAADAATRTKTDANPAPAAKGAVQPAGPPARGSQGGRNPNQRGGAQPAATSSAPPAAQTPAQVGELPRIQEVGDFYILNLDETGDGIDLEWLTKMCQVATGKNFVYDDAMQQLLHNAKVRMFGEKRIPKAEFYSFYQILMFINQFSLTKVGPDHLAVYLVQSLQAPGGGKSSLKNEALYLLPEELDKYADQVATQVITVMHLPHTDVRTLGNSLRSFTSDPTGGQGVTPVGNTNSVILTGFASNVASLAHILKLVDEESAKDIGIQPMFEVIPLEFAAAEDLSDILGELLEASKRQQQQNRQAQGAQGATGQIQTGGGETKILTYPRTNSLLVMALPDDMQAIKELVARLDVEVVEPERTYHVYVLEHVKAKDLAEVLKNFIEGASRVGGTSTGQGGGGGGRPGAAQAPQTTGLSSRDNEVVVVPDEATNSLLIAASRRRYEEVVELIHRLDHRADQVLIETALIELSGKDNLDIGVELGGANLPGSGTGNFGVTSFGLSSFTDSNGDGIPDVRTPNQSTGITAGLLDGGSFSLPVLVYALRDRNDTNVLNIPSVLVNNNGSATVKTLDEQPTTNITALGASAQTQQSFGEYQKAGITMQISPSISMSGYLRLDISLEVSNFVGTFSGAIPPPRITRTITTSVSVPNGDTMVIGGIIVDDKNETRSSVPFLGDLPILGYLFRRDQDNKNRTTLYFFVTPHILKDQNFSDLAEISYKLKLDAAEKIGTNRMQMIDHAFGASSDQVPLDGFEVPMYRSPGGGEVTPAMVGQDPVKSTKVLQAENQAKTDSKPPTSEKPGGN